MREPERFEGLTHWRLYWIDELEELLRKRGPNENEFQVG
jgi:hypothetical protein